MAIYSADPNPPRGGGLGLLRTAMSLWEHFRDGGTRDQELARKAAAEQQQRLGEQAFQQNAFNLGRNATDAQQKDAKFNSEQEAARQQFDRYDFTNKREKAMANVGVLPDLSPDGLDSAVIGFPEETPEDTLGRLKTYPWADMTPAEQEFVRRPATQIAQLPDSEIAPRWDNVVGVTTGGQAGNALTGTQSSDGKLTSSFEPVGMLQAKAADEKGKTDAAALESEKKLASDLLAKFRSERSIQNYYTSRNSVDLIANQVAASAQNPTGANDIAILTEFMRSIDPESTVREGEFNLAARSGGVPSIVLGYYNNLVGQGRLTQPQREEILAAAARNAEAHAKNTEGVRNLYVENAQRLGLSPQYFSEFEALRGSPQKQQSGQGAPQKFGSVKEAQAAGVQPGQKFLVERSGLGWEEVTVGADGSIPDAPAPVTPVPQQPEMPPGQLPNVDFNALMMGRGGVGFPRPQAKPAGPLLDYLPPELILQYPGIVAPPQPQPRHQLNAPRR